MKYVDLSKAEFPSVYKGMLSGSHQEEADLCHTGSDGPAEGYFISDKGN